MSKTAKCLFLLKMSGWTCLESAFVNVNMMRRRDEKHAGKHAYRQHAESTGDNSFLLGCWPILFKNFQWDPMAFRLDRPSNADSTGFKRFFCQCETGTIIFFLFDVCLSDLLLQFLKKENVEPHQITYFPQKSGLRGRSSWRGHSKRETAHLS